MQMVVFALARTSGLYAQREPCFRADDTISDDIHMEVRAMGPATAAEG
jgi:hypothetical protein